MSRGSALFCAFFALIAISSAQVPLTSSTGVASNGSVSPFIMPLFLSFSGLPKLPSLNPFPPAPCFGPTDQREGFCRNTGDCASVGGVPDGPCALNLGVCCLNVLKCGATSLVNNTYFQSPEYPNATTVPTECVMTVNKLANVVQVKVELMVVELAGIDSEGKCRSDTLWMEGLSPKICGKSSQQHMYLPVDEMNVGAPIRVKVALNGSEVGRRWLIKVVQLERNNPSLARDGCLQYHANRTGNVTSFNYGPEGEKAGGNIAGLRYSICFRQEEDSCSIGFSPIGSNSNTSDHVLRKREVYGNGVRYYSRSGYRQPVYPMPTAKPVTGYRPPYQSPFNDDWGMVRYNGKPVNHVYRPPYLPQPAVIASTGSTLWSSTTEMFSTTTSTVNSSGDAAEGWSATTTESYDEVENEGSNNTVIDIDIDDGNTTGNFSNGVAPVADVYSVGASDPCKGQDTVIFPPTASGSGSRVMCDSVKSRPFAINLAPFVVYVNNQGSPPGRGFSYSYKSEKC